MKKQSLFLLFFVLILCGCQFSQNAQEQPKIERELIDKKPILESSKIYSLNSIDAYYEVIDWVDDERIFYLTEQNGKSSINTFHIFTGEVENLFTSEETIVEIDIHPNKTKIAISTLNDQNRTSISILDVSGEVLFHETDLLGDVIFYWNPYDATQLLLVSYLPNWEFAVHHLSIDDGELKETEIKQTYVQWVDKETIAYIDWNLNEPSIYAPLVFYNLSTKEKEQFLDKVIACFALEKEKFLTLSVQSIYDMDTKYSFYENKQVKNETYVPILDTFSEQWWVPYFDFDEQQSQFIFFRPKYSGTFIDYDESYELVSFDVETGDDQVLLELEEHLPIKLSPSGKYLLYGIQYEQLIDLEKNETYNLITQ